MYSVEGELHDVQSTAFDPVKRRRRRRRGIPSLSSCYCWQGYSIWWLKRHITSGSWIIVRQYSMPCVLTAALVFVALTASSVQPWCHMWERFDRLRPVTRHESWHVSNLDSNQSNQFLWVFILHNYSSSLHSMIKCWSIVMEEVKVRRGVFKGGDDDEVVEGIGIEVWEEGMWKSKLRMKIHVRAHQFPPTFHESDLTQ